MSLSVCNVSVCNESLQCEMHFATHDAFDEVEGDVVLLQHGGAEEAAGARAGDDDRKHGRHLGNIEYISDGGDGSPIPSAPAPPELCLLGARSTADRSGLRGACYHRRAKEGERTRSLQDPGFALRTVLT